MKALFLVVLFVPVAAGAGIFPYPVSRKTLPNGLDVVVIETPEFKDVLSFNTMVLAGSGREREKGKTGLAHLFEHILFRHRYGGVEGGYDDLMAKLGTHNNAWTWFDITYYHPLSFASNLTRKADLPGLIDLEAARFMALDFTEKTFKTEAGAVLGEYRRNASRPTEKMEERLLALMFPGHPYGHTTIGFYDDVVDMPNHFESAKKFYDDYYRPNNCVLIVAGDVKAAEVHKLVAARYGGWKARDLPPAAREEAAPAAELREHVAWDADVAPVVWVAHRMPAFKPGSPDAAAAELLNELLVSPAAPLFKRLRYDKQVASALNFTEGPQGFQSFEPRALTVSAEVLKERFAQKGKPLLDEVAAEITAGLEALKSFSAQKDAKDQLKTIKSRYRYDTLAQLSSPEKIAEAFAWHYRFDRDPGVLDRLLESVEAVKPEDIDRLARAQFTPESRVIVTLAYEPASKKGP